MNGTLKGLLCDHAKLIIDTGALSKSDIPKAIVANFGAGGVAGLGPKEIDVQTICTLLGAVGEDDVSLELRRDDR